MPHRPKPKLTPNRPPPPPQPNAPPPPPQIGRPGLVSPSSQRVNFTDLYYKNRAENTVWTRISMLHDRGKGHETLADLVFDGGIEVCQVGSPFHEDISPFNSTLSPRPKGRQSSLKRKIKSAEDGESSVGQSSSSATTSDQFWNPPAAGHFPFGRLSENFEEDGYTEILLVSPRSTKTGNASLPWSWAATLTFLSGMTKWKSPETKKLTEEIYLRR